MYRYLTFWKEEMYRLQYPSRPDTLSAVNQHRVKRAWEAKRNEVMTHSAVVVGKMLLDNIAQEIVYYNDAVTVFPCHPNQGFVEITGLRRNACSEV